MRNRSCPNRVACFDYNANNCEECPVGDLITKQKKKIKRLQEEKDVSREKLIRAVRDVAERIKTAFYCEFEELIPSIMADKIDEIVKEVLNEHEL